MTRHLKLDFYDPISCNLINFRYVNVNFGFNLTCLYKFIEIVIGPNTTYKTGLWGEDCPTINTCPGHILSDVGLFNTYH